MFKIQGDFMITSYDEKKKKDGSSYYLVQLLTHDGSTVKIYLKEDLKLQPMKMYHLTLTITISERTYINIDSHKLVV